MPIGDQKLLFTPGPLNTKAATKAAMMCDLGSRDTGFVELVRSIRSRLLHIAGAPLPGAFEAIIMQGSGTFGIESVISSILPRKGRILIAINGAYGERMAEIAALAGLEVSAVRTSESEPIRPRNVEAALSAQPTPDAVAVVHCETTTGIVNPVGAIGRGLQGLGCYFLVDAMSSFGALPIDLEEAGVDFLITGSNKCLESVPGFSIILARRTALEMTEGFARSLSLDLHAQWRGLESNGQFRFTPPTHALLAMDEALSAFGSEGGLAGRKRRYEANHDVLMRGMLRLGFKPYLAPEHQSYIISTFCYPDHPSFCFESFYNRLGDLGFVIYPGKVTSADCFRIGTIGQISPRDVALLVDAIEATLAAMGVDEMDYSPVECLPS